MLPAAGGVAPQFMNLINPPTFNRTSNMVAMTVPTTVPAGITPVATCMALLQIQTLGTGATATEQSTRLWEVWSTTWLQQVELPNIPFTPDPKASPTVGKFYFLVHPPEPFHLVQAA